MQRFDFGLSESVEEDPNVPAYIPSLPDAVVSLEEMFGLPEGVRPAGTQSPQVAFRDLVIFLDEEIGTPVVSDAVISRSLRRARLRPRGIYRSMSFLVGTTEDQTPQAFAATSKALAREFVSDPDDGIGGLTFDFVMGPLADPTPVVGEQIPLVIRDKDFVETELGKFEGKFDKASEVGLQHTFVTQVPPAAALVSFLRGSSPITLPADKERVLGVLDSGFGRVDPDNPAPDASDGPNYSAQPGVNPLLNSLSSPLFIAGKRIVDPTQLINTRFPLGVVVVRLAVPTVFSDGDMANMVGSSNHGSRVLSAGAGDGIGLINGVVPQDPTQIVYGIGHDVLVRPFVHSVRQRGLLDVTAKEFTAWYTNTVFAFEAIARDPRGVKVLVYSLGFGFNGGGILIGEIAQLKKNGFDVGGTRTRLLKAMGSLADKNIAVIVAGGNLEARETLFDPFNVGEIQPARPLINWPQTLSPLNTSPRPAVGDNRLIVTVGGTSLDSTRATVPDKASAATTMQKPNIALDVTKRFIQPDAGGEYSYFMGGPHVSIRAPATFLRLGVPHGLPIRNKVETTGSSFAAPQVGATILQLLRIPSRDPATPAGAKLLSTREAVLYVELTADVLDRPTGAEPDERRLNCWKAVLSAANGGLSNQPALGGQGPRSGSLATTPLPVLDDSSTTYYGFEVRSLEPASVWLLAPDKTLSRLEYVAGSRPKLNVGLPNADTGAHVITYQGVMDPLLESAANGTIGFRPPLPLGRKDYNDAAKALHKDDPAFPDTARFLAQFTVARTALLSGIELRVYESNFDGIIDEVGTEQESPKPLLALPLGDLGKLRKPPENETFIRSHVRFDEFVFYVNVPGF